VTATVVTAIGLVLWAWLSDLLKWLAAHWFALLVLYLLHNIRGYIRAIGVNADHAMTRSAQELNERWREFTAAAKLNNHLKAIDNRLDAINDGVHEVDASVRAAVSEMNMVRDQVSSAEADLRNIAISTRDVVLNLRRGYN
jgi:hypothetical protein